MEWSKGEEVRWVALYYLSWVVRSRGGEVKIYWVGCKKYRRRNTSCTARVKEGGRKRLN